MLVETSSKITIFNGSSPWGKKLDGLLDAVFVDGEVFLRQPGDETAVVVEEGDREAHRVHPDSEAGNVGLLRERRCCRQGGG